MVLPNPWHTENNPSESYQVPNQNLWKNLRFELKLKRQIIGKIFKSLDKKNLLNNRMEKRSSCGSENDQDGVLTIRIQDLLH